MKRRKTKEQNEALQKYNLAVQEEDRFLGSVFVNRVSQARYEKKTRLAYETCKRLGLDYNSGL